MPLKVVVEWRRELGWTRDLRETDPRARELRRRVERYEDAGWGSCWLAREEIGALVESALFHFDGERYRLLAWCVMPNHVHVLIELVEGWPLGRLVSSWKSFTVKQANRLLGRSGAFWAGDYHDRFIRNAEHLAAVASYIEHNPAEAGLVERPQDWPFSSARARASPAGGTPADPGDRVERRRRFPES